MSRYILKTGLKSCFDAYGREVSCSGSGQDAEFGVGREIPRPRFVHAGQGTVRDEYTRLLWPADADVSDFPLSWTESLQMIESFNREEYLGRSDWRMPDRRELRSLIDHEQRMPALPRNSPFSGIRESWYWTGTSSAMFPDYAWYIHFAGGRMFWGRKDQQAFCRPVCGGSDRILPTGQSGCFDDKGSAVDCSGIYALADGMVPVNWEFRFRKTPLGIEDGLTGLLWYARPFYGGREMKWQEALDAVSYLNSSGKESWRMPNINELESLVDCSRHSPALPSDFSGQEVREVYWSSSTSGFEFDWAFALYLYKGAVGVGHKATAEYALWPVADAKV